MALIGYGLAGSCFHAPFIAATAGLSLVRIVTRDAARRAQAGRDHPDARLADTADELWREAGELDLVVVASPNRTHVPLARAAIDRGLHVVVDKPAAPSAAEARALLAHAQARGVVLTVYQNRRWDGDFQTLRQIVGDGAVGQPLTFESRFERWRPEITPGWRQRPTPEDAGGLLFDLGSHLIDQARLLFGPVARVYAELDRRRHGSAVDDHSFVALTHGSGVRSHLFMSTMTAQAGPRFRLLGSKGAFVKYGMDVQEDALRAGRRPGGPDWGSDPVDRWGQLGHGDALQAVPTARGDYQEFYRRLVAAIGGASPAPVDPSDAVAALDVIEAARRADREGRIVELTPHAEDRSAR